METMTNFPSTGVITAPAWHATTGEPVEIVLYILYDNEYIECIKQKNGLYRCIVINNNQRAFLRRCEPLGEFDDVVKGDDLSPAGNNHDIGMIGVYPRYKQKVECRAIVDGDKRILECTTAINRRKFGHQ